jgi:hypothetical protein
VGNPKELLSKVSIKVELKIYNQIEPETPFTKPTKIATNKMMD